jgi:hypothetical protein
MSGRPWTQAEIDLVLAKYGKIGVGRIAKQVGRTVSAVYQLAAARCDRLMLPKGWWRGELEQLVRDESAKGSLDTDIVRLWNAAHPDRSTGRRYIGDIRKRLGIDYEQQLATLKSRQRAGNKNQLQTLHVKSIKDLSRRARRRVAIERGWPTDCSPAECDVLDVLAPSVRMTRRQIAEALGRGDRPMNRLFASGRNGVSALNNLVGLGWAVRSPGRPVAGSGRGHSCAAYSLSQKAREWHKRAKRGSLLA